MLRKEQSGESTLNSPDMIGADVRQYFQACRKPERTLNDCVFSKLVGLKRSEVKRTPADDQNLQKKIPGSPEGQDQVHEKKSPIFTRVQK